MRRKSFKQHLFSMIPRTNIARSQFNRSFNHKTTMNSGKLVPIMVDEILPGQTVNLRPFIFARLATLAVPVMDNCYFDTFAFFVPNRLVWEHWVNFCGEQVNPDDSIDYLIPTLDSPSNGFEVGSLADYFGIPTGVPLKKVNALPFRCYNLIYNEWFRDENLQDSLVVNKSDTDDINNYTLVNRGKRHDYFTSALPFPQKGEDVVIPLIGNAPVIGNGLTLGLTDGTNNVGLTSYGGSLDLLLNSTTYGQNVGHVGTSSSPGITSFSGIGVTTDIGKSGMVTDLSTVSATDINSLRTAFQIQKFLERQARGGTRYTEVLLSHFGVKSPDARLQRPEYLGGGSTRINVNSIAQTSATDATSPQGNLSAFGYVSSSKGGFTKSFVEHGYLIVLANIRADLNYQQGLNKMWSRQTLYDFYWPSFAHLGEQAILNKEIVATGSPADDEVFGYQERYAEYRYKPNTITGQFRSSYAQSLDVWHFAQDFGNSAPALNADFIQDNPPIRRALAVTDENYPEFLVDINFKYLCVSPMPAYGVPGLVDHF